MYFKQNSIPIVYLNKYIKTVNDWNILLNQKGVFLSNVDWQICIENSKQIYDGLKLQPFLLLDPPYLNEKCNKIYNTDKHNLNLHQNLQIFLKKSKLDFLQWTNNSKIIKQLYNKWCFIKYYKVKKRTEGIIYRRDKTFIHQTLYYYFPYKSHHDIYKNKIIGEPTKKKRRSNINICISKIYKFKNCHGIQSILY